jgi:hypothetical protein
MNTIKSFFNRLLNANTLQRQLYKHLDTDAFRPFPTTQDLGEGMSIVSEVICGYRKPRFLMDNNTKCAYEFMDNDERLVTVYRNDIDWDSQQSFPQKAIECAKRLSFHFPSFVKRFQNGVAEVIWQLNPDGRYYMDEDGFGMTDDEEINIYGFIDRTGTAVVKFQAIENYKQLYTMRQEAEKAVQQRTKTKKSNR